jgi:hypothetical protein
MKSFYYNKEKHCVRSHVVIIYVDTLFHFLSVFICVALQSTLYIVQTHICNICSDLHAILQKKIVKQLLVFVCWNMCMPPFCVIQSTWYDIADVSDFN